MSKAENPPPYINEGQGAPEATPNGQIVKPESSPRDAQTTPKTPVEPSKS